MGGGRGRGGGKGKRGGGVYSYLGGCICRVVQKSERQLFLGKYVDVVLYFFRLRRGGFYKEIR